MGGALLLLAGCVAWLARRVVGLEEAALAMPSGGQSSAEAAKAQPRRKGERLGAGTSEPATSSPPPPAGQIDRDEVLARGQKLLDEMTEEDLAAWWEDRFSREPPSDDAESFERDIVEPSVTDALPKGARLTRSECRKGYCRLEVHYKNIYAHNDFVGQLYRAEVTPFTEATEGLLTVEYHQIAPDDWVATVLIARKGSLLIPH